MTPCCWLEVQILAQALKSAKGPGNTFDSIPKWPKTLPLGIFLGIFIEPHPPLTICFSNIKVDIWHPVVGLRCRNPTRHFWFNPQVGRHFAVGNFKWDINRASSPHFCSDIKVDIWQPAVGLSCQNHPPRYLCQLMTLVLSLTSWDIYRAPPFNNKN